MIRAWNRADGLPEMARRDRLGLMAAVSLSGNGLQGGVDDLALFIGRARRLVVLTGAGCSTESGIPDYRDVDGEWKHRRPVQFADFVGDEYVRQRYWARSLVGWRRVEGAEPNAAHRALARLEQAGAVHWLVTQNVDGLHQRAGSRRITDLHGRIDRVVCLDCGRLDTRDALQGRLVAENPEWADLDAASAPDGDAFLEGRDFRAFRVPCCAACGGMLKPDVVFFGEGVPKRRVGTVMDRLEASDALLVVGSSLMVWSGYRFARLAAERGLPVAAVNLGRTRADHLLSLKVNARCGEVLASLASGGGSFRGP